MKLLFKNNTKYTKANYHAFIEFHKNKFGVRMLMKIGILLLCLGYIVIVNAMSHNWKGILIFILIGVILYFLQYIKENRQEKNNNKMLKKSNNFTFYFYEKYIKIRCGRKFDRLRYFEIHKVFETKQYFFLYTDESHSLILHKEGFEIGTSKDFAEFMRKKYPLKYKREK